MSAATIPYKYPLVNKETRKTDNTKMEGISDCVLNIVCISKLKKKNRISIKNVVTT